MPELLVNIRWLRGGFCFTIVVMILAFLILFLSAWMCDDRRLYSMMEQRITFEYLQQIIYATNIYHENHGRFPKSFDDLRSKEFRNFLGIANEAGEPCDEWWNPLVYVETENTPRVISFGKDGKPGGEGPDRDLSSDDSMTLPPFPLRNFLKSRLGPLAFTFSFNAGVVAVVLFLITVRPKQFLPGVRLPWIHLLVITAISLMVGFLTLPAVI